MTFTLTKIEQYSVIKKFTNAEQKKTTTNIY